MHRMSKLDHDARALVFDDGATVACAGWVLFDEATGRGTISPREWQDVQQPRSDRGENDSRCRLEGTLPPTDLLTESGSHLRGWATITGHWSNRCLSITDVSAPRFHDAWTPSAFTRGTHTWPKSAPPKDTLLDFIDDRQRTWDITATAIASGPTYTDVVVIALGRVTQEIADWHDTLPAELVTLRPWLQPAAYR